MTLLRDIPFKAFYRPTDELLESFYVPALGASIQYDRSAGFFSSTALAVAARGVAHLIRNGGRMRLLVGASLSLKDVEAVARGEELRHTLTQPLLERFPDPQDALQRQRLEVLAWMVAAGTLEMKVVLPLGPDGRIIPGPATEDYYHAKKGIFADRSGSQVAFVGSVNESEQGWRHNFEEFSVYLSWESEREQQGLALVRLSFEQLWSGDERDWVAVDIPEAVRERLIRYAPDQAPDEDPIEKRNRVERIREAKRKLVGKAAPKERVLCQFLKDAPRLLNARDLAAATSAIRPWPHQLHVAHEVLRRYPEGSLLCDEVGLGKTIEAGLVIRSLLTSRKVQRCLILTPRSILRQWQEELYEKFGLDVPRYEGGKICRVRGASQEMDPDSIWDAFDVLLATSQLAKRRARLPGLQRARPWDLLVIDEAHHARRKDFLDPRYRPNRLLVLLETLRSMIGGLLLVTATPMQVHPLEIWDLLVQLGMGGVWAADQENFLRYFRELRLPFDQVDWDFVLDMVNDQLAAGQPLEPALEQLAVGELGLPVWRQLASLPGRPRPRTHALRELPEAAHSFLYELARRHTPLAPYMFRNTRTLLRRYQEQGLLPGHVPTRRPEVARIAFTEEEEALYRRVDEYITRFYHKYENERRGLGFVMTIYRRRLTSSFFALRKSLERRVEFLRGQISLGESIEEDDIEQEELDLDIGDEILSEADRERFSEELRYVETFLLDLRTLSAADSKMEYLKGKLGDVFRERNKVLVFTQYTDTMDYVRNHLQVVYGTQVACYSGRGGESFNGLAWVPAPKEDVKKAFLEGDVRILVCTEAASEGINLQTCGAMINYDMPWNPMRVEQRIGRIDRIGQLHDVVWITSCFYRDTIEDQIYQRLKDRIHWFEQIVGNLQPILAEIGEMTRKLAMLPEEIRQQELERRIGEIRDKIDRARAEVFDVDSYANERVQSASLVSPVTMSVLEAWLAQECSSTAWRFQSALSIDRAYELDLGDVTRTVTFDPGCFDRHPDSVEFLTYGNPALTALLETVPGPGPEDYGNLIRQADPNMEGVAWFVCTSAGVKSVEAFQDLAAAYEPGGEVPESALESAEEGYRREVGRWTERIAQVRERQLERQGTALRARARRLLVAAALVEISLGRSPELFEDQVYPTEFTAATVKRLQRHRYPWAPLVSFGFSEDLVPVEDDPFLEELRGLSGALLKLKFRELQESGDSLLEDVRSLDAE